MDLSSAECCFSSRGIVAADSMDFSSEWCDAVARACSCRYPDHSRSSVWQSFAIERSDQEDFRHSEAHAALMLDNMSLSIHKAYVCFVALSHSSSSIRRDAQHFRRPHDTSLLNPRIEHARQPAVDPVIPRLCLNSSTLTDRALLSKNQDDEVSLMPS